MALPYLIKRIYNSSSEEVVRRGKKIFNTTNSIELIDYDELMGNINFRVKDDGYHTFYKVYLNQFRAEKSLTLRCTCPYNLTEVCRHKAASLFHLQELLDKNMLGNNEIEYNQKHTVIKMKAIDLKLLKMLSGLKNYTYSEEFLRANKPRLIDAKDETVWAEVSDNYGEHKLLIRKNEERNFDTSCTCKTETKHPLCIHKTILFLQLLHNHGANYFDSIRNWDTVKNKLLALYGYSLDDDLTDKFEFTYQEGRPFLRALDSSIKRVAAPLEAVAKSKYFEQELVSTAPVILESFAEEKARKPEFKLGVVFNTPSNQFPFLQVDAIQGVPNETSTGYVTKIEKLDLNKYVNLELFNDEDKDLILLIRKFLPSEVSKYINRNSPFGGVWEHIIQQQDEELPQETREIIAEYFHPKLKKIFEEQSRSNYIFQLPENKMFTSLSIKNIFLSEVYLSPYFLIHKKNSVYQIECRVSLPQIDLNINESENISPLIFQYNETIYLWDRYEDIHTLEKFLPTGFLNIEPEDWNQQLEDFIVPLSKEYNIKFDNIKKEEVKNIKPKMSILLKEKGEYLIFEPVFSYNDYSIKPDDKKNIVLPFEDKILIIHRNIEAEDVLAYKIQNLHSLFVRPNINTNTLALRGAEVLKNNWFFLFIDAAKEMEISVYGFDTLKRFRFNVSKPSTKIYISSNTDWFDAKVEIDFGGQKVTVADVKKALANKQQFVPLSDGSLGILPEDWIRKYSLLFKVGEGKQDSMKLSKFQFSVIEDLYNQRDEEELFVKLEEKYDKLRYNYEIKEIDTPEHLTPILRPYQISGFQWLNYLREVQWGGILADDMGLGKTVQALSYLNHLKNEQGNLKALVICPTTLMFNWQNEIKKFTPSLNYYVHHGGGRMKDELKEKEADVIITTYGTLRSDIKEFIQIEFDYVILDESQAIKNPASKVTKAACLLRAKSRLCLSGTPLQNNTFDIFAQMNFLNPGMLGSQEFFKSEFAVPIDRFGEKDQKDHLRKLLYPFILRRTKEQVAKDLPEKQEMILYCEMGDEQRKIYEAYRNDFRDKILGVVEEKGANRSQLTILQGLMKLRQICDSPAILKENDGEKYPNVSVKLEEIGREIAENISNHKALVFSQFLGMLALIKERLIELEVDFEYFDGSSSAAERERAITRFQNDENCRVFLISLKAGGVGLNLTAADYVYIVDPWWNPAVEQQAIDRTHRIGQTKNIFAYRMICTDTVEDKIIKLQEKKRILAKDLITDDDGFVKTLTKEDVEYLFS